MDLPRSLSIMGAALGLLSFPHARTASDMSSIPPSPMKNAATFTVLDGYLQDAPWKEAAAGVFDAVNERNRSFARNIVDTLGASRISAGHLDRGFYGFGKPLFQGEPLVGAQDGYLHECEVYLMVHKNRADQPDAPLWQGLYKILLIEADATYRESWRTLPPDYSASSHTRDLSRVQWKARLERALCLNPDHAEAWLAFSDRTPRLNSIRIPFLQNALVMPAELPAPSRERAEEELKSAKLNRHNFDRQTARQARERLEALRLVPQPFWPSEEVKEAERSLQAAERALENPGY